MGEDSTTTRGEVGTEPGCVAGGSGGGTTDIRVGIGSIRFCSTCGSVYGALLGRRTPDEAGALGQIGVPGGTVGGEFARDMCLVSGIDVGVERADTAILLNDVKEVIGLKVICINARSGEVVGIGHCANVKRGFLDIAKIPYSHE